MENLNNTTENTAITIEQLGEKLGGKLWIKGDMKRIYLDRGYNTKKMSTKTYVFHRENGTFGVSCYIECPSQDFNWIKSQQEEVINNVLEDIEETLLSFKIENELNNSNIEKVHINEDNIERIKDFINNNPKYKMLDAFSINALLNIASDRDVKVWKKEDYILFTTNWKTNEKDWFPLCSIGESKSMPVGLDINWKDLNNVGFELLEVINYSNGN